MRNVLLFLHIASAILIIGGLAFMDMVVPAMVRGGSENLSALRKLHKLGGVFGPASAIVFILGLILAITDPADIGYDLGEPWLSISMLLFIVAAVLGSAVAAKRLGKAIARLESGDSAADDAGRLSMLGGINILILLTIVWLMVDKPGFKP